MTTYRNEAELLLAASRYMVDDESDEIGELIHIASEWLMPDGEKEMLLETLRNMQAVICEGI